MIRHHARIARAAALTLALTAIAATPASATPPPAGPGPCSEVCSGGGYGSRVSRPAATPTNAGPGSDVSSTNGYDFARVPPTVVRIISDDNGFHWGDASIGAGGALGLMLAATGGTLLLAHRRTQSRTAS
jgi:hypothetical protein